jgi:glucoamylase
MPPQTAQRYLESKTISAFVLWQFNHKIRFLPAGKILRVEALAAGLVHWSTDGWATAEDAQLRDTHLGLFVADLPTQGLEAGGKVDFTFYWSGDDHWEDQNFQVLIS